MSNWKGGHGSSTANFMHIFQSGPDQIQRHVQVIVSLLASYCLPARPGLSKHNVCYIKSCVSGLSLVIVIFRTCQILLLKSPKMECSYLSTVLVYCMTSTGAREQLHRLLSHLCCVSLWVLAEEC